MALTRNIYNHTVLSATMKPEIKTKKKILLHVIKSEKIGGTTTVISEIKNSDLNKSFEFKDIVQEESCGLNPIKAFKFINKYRRQINSQKADGIYICGLLYSGFLMTVASKLSNVKKIYLSVHGSEWDRNKISLLRKTIFCKIIEPLSVRLADKVFTVCKNGLKNPALKLGGHGNIIGEIYNRMPYIDYEKFQDSVGDFRNEINCSDDKIIVAVVGRVVYDKGHKFIIEAIKKFGDDQFIFVIVGDGDYLSEYHKELYQEIESSKVHILGSRNDVFRILNDSDIFLFASLHENHSKALLEAVSMRCAVICTNVGGNPEIIENEKTGIIIPAEDSESIVNALKELKNSDKRKYLIDNATNSIPDKFSYNNTFGKLKKIFDEEI